MHSIRIRITAITIAAILTSVLSVLCASLFTVEAEHDSNSAQVMNLLSRNTQLALDDYLESVQQSVEMAANIASDTLDSVVLVENGAAGSAAKAVPQTSAQRARLDAYLAVHCDRIQEAFSSVANHTHGVVSYYYCIAPEISASQHGFFYSRVGKTGFEEQTPLDARELDRADTAHNTWYFTPISRGRPSWVGPYPASFFDDQQMLSYLVPIYKAGALIGVLGMDVPFDTLVEQIRPIRVYDTGFACLFDEEGNILYHPEYPMGEPAPEGAFPSPVAVFRRENSGEELIRYSAGGQARQMAFSTLHSGMKLVVTAPVREINASWTHLNHIILMATAVIIGVFSLILMLVMTLLTRPLHRLTAASERLADGDYDVALDYAGSDEVGTLTRAFSRMRDHLKAYISDLNRRVISDDLTGLPSMSHFFDLAEAGRAELAAQGRQPVIVFLDLIGMKHFNRQNSFEEGDRLLCAVAEILASRFGHDCCARLGQDHFAVLSQEEGLTDTLRAVFRDCRRANGGNSLPVRVGIYPDSMERVSVSVACDRAKYAADRHRGSYISDFYRFDETMLRQIENQRYIITNLDRALSERWIQVYFQPIVRAASGQVCDEEALSRWLDPVRGSMSPEQFIPILEDARLIYKLDLYVLDQILSKMRAQREAGIYVVPQSLNLSRTDFDACDIVEEVRRRVDEAGISRDKLTIEVTESCVGSDFEFMKEQVERFHALGFQVWMDDFGSGYSSLDVLKDIHFDLLKFDMRFMHRFGESDESKIIITELMRMAIRLGVETITEGVETQEQVDFLKEVGCTKLQGYYFGKAQSVADIVDRRQSGSPLGYENPAESGYYTAIGLLNLHDLSAMSADGDLGTTFDSLPMAVIEAGADHVQLIRCNHSYRELLERNGGDAAIGAYDHLPPDSAIGKVFSSAVARCREAGSRVFVEDTLSNGTIVHAMLRHVAENPVTGIVSYAVVVLSITEPAEQQS